MMMANAGLKNERLNSGARTTTAIFFSHVFSIASTVENITEHRTMLKRINTNQT